MHMFFHQTTVINILFNQIMIFASSVIKNHRITLHTLNRKSRENKFTSAGAFQYYLHYCEIVAVCKRIEMISSFKLLQFVILIMVWLNCIRYFFFPNTNKKQPHWISEKRSEEKQKFDNNFALNDCNAII